MEAYRLDKLDSDGASLCYYRFACPPEERWREANKRLAGHRENALLSRLDPVRRVWTDGAFWRN